MRERVEVTEVGPRDGLQNQPAEVPTAAKIALVEGLARAGFRQIEVSSFVHPKRVPRMADAEAVFRGIQRREGVRHIALVPNVRGYDRAASVGCDTIALFTAASEDFAHANLNMTIAGSLERFAAVATRAHADGVAVRGYVSTVFACPYAGPTNPDQVVPVVERLFDLGCYEVSLGDTVGVGTPAEVNRLLDVLEPRVSLDRIVMHFHDTWGMGVANVVASLQRGIRRFDSSAGGLGGCPYAPGATGNLATEDLLYLLDHLGYDTGVDADRVVDAVHALAGQLGYVLPGRVYHAMVAARGASC